MKHRKLCAVKLTKYKQYKIKNGLRVFFNAVCKSVYNAYVSFFKLKIE